MNRDVPHQDQPGRKPPAASSGDTPELEKSRLYKLKVDLLAELQSAPARHRQDIVERLKTIERRIKELQSKIRCGAGR